MSKTIKPITAVVLFSNYTFIKGKKSNIPTGFAEKIKTGRKLHTIRRNYAYWAEKIAKMQESGGVLSLRQWGDLPYRSKQEVIIDVPGNVAGIQKLELTKKVEIVGVAKQTGKTIYSISYSAKVDGHARSISEIAENDGLTFRDFIEWFAPIFEEKEAFYPELTEAYKKTGGSVTIDLALIHFTPARYTGKYAGTLE